MGERDELTYNATLILQAMARGCRYGLEVIELTGLSSGTVYPNLRRLEADGLVTSAWEGATRARADGRPRRRYYDVTASGREALEVALSRIRERQRLLGFGPEGPAPEPGVD